MRVLLIEDQIAQVAAIIRALGDKITFEVATNRDEALGFVQDQKYDLAVCDLKIPSGPGAVAEVEHGLAVLTAIRSQCPGTPIIGFTAYKTRDVLNLLLEEQRREDFLGTLDERPLLTVMEKDELPEFLERLSELHRQFISLDEIQIVLELGHPDYEESVKRVLRLYARQRDCTIVRAKSFTGGQSGIPVLRIAMEKADGASRGSAVARIASVPAVAEERRRFQQRVSGFLPLGSYAEIVGHVQAGAANMGGIFYQVAEGFRPLFELIAEDDARSAEAVRELAIGQEPWRTGAPAGDMMVEEIRRILLSDARWAEVLCRCGLDPGQVAAIEQRFVPIRRSTAHGDFHGDNVLVDDHPVMIDFASVTDGPTPLDPVTLELSLLFHPHAPEWDGGWPALEQMQRWQDFDFYVAQCPFPMFVRACREWALAVARANLDIYAVAYAVVASQARFETSRPERLTPLMAGLRHLLG